MRYCNPMKSAAAALIVLLIASSAAAQRSRPPSRSDMRPTGPHKARPIAPPPPRVPAPSQPPSPFAARPETYAPHYDVARPAPRYRSPGYGVPFYSGAIGIGDGATSAFPEPLVADEGALAIQSQDVARLSSSAESARALTPHGPDTFYVIAGCYAGNRPPNPDRLPKGCDVAKLKATPVR